MVFFSRKFTVTVTGLEPTFTRTIAPEKNANLRKLNLTKQGYNKLPRMGELEEGEGRDLV